MKKNMILLAFVLIVVAVGGGSFYGGMQYGKAKSASAGGFAGFSAEQRQDRFNQMAGAGSKQGTGRGILGGTAGEIISRGDDSITVKLNDGGSKIVLFSTSTQVMKSSAGSSDDLVIGESVTVIGTANQDGSITAQSIQTRPKMTVPAPTSQ
ncbi:MAG: DUF5666 domain-containing protein [Candidatus Pacebacteria bacterium]|nr:DUF5666 domain-containing protein [Candidatus Paceibacterota bacterium]